MIPSRVNREEASNVPANTGSSGVLETSARTAATSKEINPKEASFPYIYSFGKTGDTASA